MSLRDLNKLFCKGGLATAASLFAFNANANTGAVEKGLGLQPAATEVMKDITFFYDVILVPIMIIISIFVLALLIYVVFRFNEKANPKPATFTHNVPLEIAWTAIPVFILLVISVFSFPLLYKEDVVPKNYDLTIKAIGHQWYWDHEYVDHEGVSITSNVLPKKDADAQGKPYLLATDNAVIVPVNKIVRMQVTATDVIHAWTIPAFGAKIDAIPGTLNETWFKAEKTGTYYGQCSEICGINHSAMPIEFKVVTQAEFDAWIASQKSASVSTIQFAQAE